MFLRSMLILAKFLARKIIKTFEFNKAEVLYFSCWWTRRERDRVRGEST